MKKALLLLLITSIVFSAFRTQGQAIQGSIKIGSNPKEIVLTIRNNSTSPIVGNVTKVMFTLHKFFNGWATPNGFRFQNIYTLPTPSTGSFSNESFSSFLINYLSTTWTGSKAIDLDPGESMDLIGFSFSVEKSGYPDEDNRFNQLRLYCIRSKYPYMVQRAWSVEVDGVDRTSGSQDLFYSTGPDVSVSHEPAFYDPRTASVTLDNFGIANLPVKLNDFEAKAEGNVSHLKWSTSEEINSDYFSIEHGLDAKQWKEVGRVDSHKESRELRHYDFTHSQTSPGINYYRLKMVDLDGTYAYSQIVKVNIEGDAKESIYPNPVTSKFELTNGGLNGVSKVRIFDVSGKLVHETAQIDQSGISIGHLASGIFVIELEKAGGALQKHRILKK